MLEPPPPHAAGVAVPRSHHLRSLRSPRRAVLLLGAWLVFGSGMAGPVAGADGPTMDARALLQGHSRVGSWLAIEVHLQNDGAPIVGELRLQGGAQGGTRFSLPIDLASPADKKFILYAQPPSFGQQRAKSREVWWVFSAFLTQLKIGGRTPLISINFFNPGLFDLAISSAPR